MRTPACRAIVAGLALTLALSTAALANPPSAAVIRNNTDVPSSADRLNRIAQNLNTTVTTGPDKPEFLNRIANSDVIYLSTHIDSSGDDRGSIVLANGDRVSMQEVSNALNGRRPRLVATSGCEMRCYPWDRAFNAQTYIASGQNVYNQSFEAVADRLFEAWPTGISIRQALDYALDTARNDPSITGAPTLNILRGIERLADTLQLTGDQNQTFDGKPKPHNQHPPKPNSSSAPGPTSSFRYIAPGGSQFGPGANAAPLMAAVSPAVIGTDHDRLQRLMGLGPRTGRTSVPYLRHRDPNHPVRITRTARPHYPPVNVNRLGRLARLASKPVRHTSTSHLRNLQHIRRAARIVARTSAKPRIHIAHKPVRIQRAHIQLRRVHTVRHNVGRLTRASVNSRRWR